MIANIGASRRLTTFSPGGGSTPSSSGNSSIPNRNSAFTNYGADNSSSSPASMNRTGRRTRGVTPLEKLLLKKKARVHGPNSSTSKSSSSSAASSSRKRTSSPAVPLERALKLRKLALEIEKKKIERQTAEHNLFAEKERTRQLVLSLEQNMLLEQEKTKQVSLNLDLQREINKGHELLLEKRKIRTQLTPATPSGPVAPQDSCLGTTNHGTTEMSPAPPSTPQEDSPDTNRSHRGYPSDGGPAPRTLAPELEEPTKATNESVAIQQEAQGSDDLGPSGQDSKSQHKAPDHQETSSFGQDSTAQPWIAPLAENNVNQVETQKLEEDDIVWEESDV